MKTKIRLDLPDAQEIIRKKGLGPNGGAQLFHTGNVLRRMEKYIPKDTSALIKQTIIATTYRTNEILHPGPYANYLFGGKIMIDPEIQAAGFLTDKGRRSRKGAVKVLTDRDLDLSRGKNREATPHWDRTLVKKEGKEIVQELQDYLDRRK